MSEPVRAAGGVVSRRGEILLVHRPKYGDWTLPKGKAKPGETDEACALREVEEETGLRCELGRELETARYRTLLGGKKVVRYWDMRPLEGSFRPSKEIDEIRWLPPERATALLSYEREVAVVRSLAAPRLLVVRHASAGDRREWDGDDRVRPLDEHGQRQAARLVETLAGYAVTRVVSSPFMRCVQTVEPLAAARGLDVEVSEALREGAGPERARALLNELAGTPAVACGHRQELVPLFGPTKKGATWVLDTALGPLDLLSD